MADRISLQSTWPDGSDGREQSTEAEEQQPMLLAGTRTTLNPVQGGGGEGGGGGRRGNRAWVVSATSLGLLVVLAVAVANSASTVKSEGRWWPSESDPERSLAANAELSESDSGDSEAAATAASLRQGEEEGHPGAQVEALMVFKASGDGHGLAQTWLKGGDPCDGSWAGVCCDPGGWNYVAFPPHCPDTVAGRHRGGEAQVTGLHFEAVPFGPLTGDLAPLGQLGRSLVTLDLKGTSVTGTLSALAPLIGLAFLDLSNSGPTHTCSVGGELSSLSAMTQLATLHMDDCGGVRGDVSALAGADLRFELVISQSATTTGWPLHTRSG
eukprot:SAG22_NODE_271_length_13227_cov_34.282983_2_plen_326_part_00